MVVARCVSWSTANGAHKSTLQDIFGNDEDSFSGNGQRASRLKLLRLAYYPALKSKHRVKHFSGILTIASVGNAESHLLC